MTHAEHRQQPVIYLDNNATTKVAPEVIEAMLPFFGSDYGNPSSIHRFGGLVRRHVDHSREQIAALLHAKPSQIYFTAGGSESDNLTLQGFASRRKNHARIITSAVEHHAILHTCDYLRKIGVEIIELPVDNKGRLDIARFTEMPFDENTLVSLMWANNETGVLFPIEQIAQIVKSRGAYLHTDAVQVIGKIPIDLDSVPVDFLALSGHKLHAPKGIGALFVRDTTELAPLIYGGHQEGGLRAGTENVPSIVGLGEACELAGSYLGYEATRIGFLRDKLEGALLASCKGAKLNGDPGNRVPNTTNISFEFIEGESILLLLDEAGICASSGSACTTGSLEPSHVLRAMDVPYTLAHSATRFSLSRYTTEAEIDRVIEIMPGIVEKLRALSPFVNQKEKSRTRSLTLQ